MRLDTVVPLDTTARYPQRPTQSTFTPESRTIWPSFAISAAMFSPTHAQTTTKPVKILGGFPPGGAADIFARRIADRLR